MKILCRIPSPLDSYSQNIAETLSLDFGAPILDYNRSIVSLNGIPLNIALRGRRFKENIQRRIDSALGLKNNFTVKLVFRLNFKGEKSSDFSKDWAILAKTDLESTFKLKLED